MKGKSKYGSFCITPVSIPIDYGGKFYKIELRVLMKYGWIDNVTCYLSSYTKNFSINLEFKEKEGDYAVFEANKVLLENSPRYLMYFTFFGNGRYYVFKKFDYYGDNSTAPEELFQFSVGFRVPEWAKGAIMYHIFVDSFYRDWSVPIPTIDGRIIIEDWLSDPHAGPNEDGVWCMEFYGGNLSGIEKCLAYLKRLGVTIIFLSPLMDAKSNHRYDTNDYERIDPFLGTNGSKKHFCDMAHRFGMKVIEDIVFNHVGKDSKYFNAAGKYPNPGYTQDPLSKYGLFFALDDEGKIPCWWGDTNLPIANGYSVGWQNYIYGDPINGIVKLIFNSGIDGVRFDVLDELLDFFIEGVVQAGYHFHPNPFMVGEVWENPVRKGRLYLTSGKGVHSVMNYYLHWALIKYFKYADCNILESRTREIVADYPPETRLTLLNFTSTHDISRLEDIYSAEYDLIDDDGNIDLKYARESGERLIFNRDAPNGPWVLFDESPDFANSYYLPNWKKKLGKRVVIAHAIFLAFYPGIFTIFYGDEVGKTGIGNIKNRGAYPWARRDKKTMKIFRKVLKVRAKNDFLRTADATLPKAEKYYTYYERIGEEDSIFVAVSRSRFYRPIKVPEKYLKGEVIFRHGKSTTEYLAPYGAIVLKLHTR